MENVSVNFRLMIYDPLNDGKSKLELISYMGSDLDIVNDAKASFGRTSDALGEKEIKLIKYLIKHNHTSPFRGVVFKFKVSAPLFVARQWWKHVLASNHNDEQLGWNEQSLRYVSIDSPDFYIPDNFRLQSENNKQASEGILDKNPNAVAKLKYERVCNKSYETYKQLLALGVCREQARGILVPTIYTSWVWTVSLQALLHFIGLRLGKGAQDEIIKYAECCLDAIKDVTPETIKIWEELGRECF